MSTAHPPAIQPPCASNADTTHSTTSQHLPPSCQRAPPRRRPRPPRATLLQVACCQEAAACGVLVAMNDSIHLASYVRKSDSQLIGSFRSHPGPIGQVRSGGPVFYYGPPPSLFDRSRDFSKLHLAGTPPSTLLPFGRLDVHPRAARHSQQTSRPAAFHLTACIQWHCHVVVILYICERSDTANKWAHHGTAAATKRSVPSVRRRHWQPLQL
jgi:hypothetical protein